MEIITVLLILWAIFAHWIADFVFQAEVWALNKKESFKALTQHTVTYTAMMILLFFNILSPLHLLLFAVGLFTTHTLIDYITSKIVGGKFANKQLGGPIPNTGAFTMIGLDQVLHYVTILFLLYFCYNK